MADGREATGAGRTTAMALSGGIALGAYHAGACAALHEEGGGDLRLDWLAGASIGAVTAAIVAGNPPGRRVERLRRFWDAAVAGLAPPGPPGLGGPGPDAPWRRTQGWASALQARLLGRPGLFRPRLFAAADGGARVGPEHLLASCALLRQGVPSPRKRRRVATTRIVAVGG